MRRLSGILAVSVVLLAGCGGGSDEVSQAASDQLMVRGSMVLVGGGNSGSTSMDCRGDGGFTDIRPGAQVVVRSGEGDVIGTGSLQSYESRKQIEERLALDLDDTEEAVSDLYDSAEGSGRLFCPFWFDVEVGDADFYEVTIGRRGEQVKSRADLEAADWRVGFTLNGL